MTPDRRRAVRTTVHTIGAVAMLGMLAWIVWRIPDGKLQAIALGLILILMLREVFHGAENVTARIKFGAGRDGVNAEVDPGDV